MEMEIVMILGGASDSDALILDTPSTKAVELYKREEEAMKCGIFSDLCIPDVPEELHRATAIYEENENRVLVCGGGKTHNIVKRLGLGLGLGIENRESKQSQG